jgi:hypothetical protein
MAPPLLPITRLVQCSGCDAHVKRGEVVCPHCGALVDGRSGLGKMVGAAAVAGVMSSCIIAEPAYGVVVQTDTGSDSGTETDSNSTGGVTEATDTGEPTGTGTGTATDSMGTMNPETGESDYGVPTTDETAGTETGSESGSESGSETGTTGGETGTTGTGTDSAGEADYGVPSTF